MREVNTSEKVVAQRAALMRFHYGFARGVDRLVHVPLECDVDFRLLCHGRQSGEHGKPKYRFFMV